MCLALDSGFADGRGTGVSPVSRFHDSHGRDARATTLLAETPTTAGGTPALPCFQNAPENNSLLIRGYAEQVLFAPNQETIRGRHR